MPSDQLGSSPPNYELTEKLNDSSTFTSTSKNADYTAPPDSLKAEQRQAANKSQPRRDHGESVQQQGMTPHSYHPRRSDKKPRRSLRHREPRSCGMVWRILLSASLFAAIVYAAITPSALRQNTALCVALGVGSFVAAAQFYIIVTRFLRCVPYSIWVVVALDFVSLLGWCAAVAVLSYWHREVLYRPREGDALAWHDCYNAPNGFSVYDAAARAGTAVNIVWCGVDVDGRRRLVGNGAARLQLRTVIGLSAVSLFFNAIVLYISVRKQRNPTWGNL